MPPGSPALAVDEKVLDRMHALGSAPGGVWKHG